MYSPAARPSRQRAAPAKKRRLSAITGISSFVDRLDRLAGVERLQARELLAVLLDQRRRAPAAPARAAPASSATSPSNARRAASTARSTSSALETGARASSSPVAGLSTASVSPCGGHALAVDEVAERVCGARHRLSSRCRGVRVGRLGFTPPSCSASATAGWVISPARTFKPMRRPGFALQGAVDPVLGQLDHVRQRRVRERVGRGDRHRARHVRDAVVGDRRRPRTSGRSGSSGARSQSSPPGRSRRPPAPRGASSATAARA